MGLFDDVLSQNRTTNAGSGLFDDVLGEQSPKPPAPKGGLMAAAKQGIGASIKGIGQAAADFLPGVTRDNPVSAYGQSVIDANPTAVNSLGDIVESPWQATKEAVGNAAGSMGSMLGARALGMGITAAAPFTGPAAPIVAGAGQLVANVGPFVAAALPSYGGIRESQILADPANEADGKSKAIAALGAGTVGAIEGAFGPEAWALAAMRKGGIESVAKKFADSKSIAGAVGKGIARGAAVEGAEELVQNPIEQAAGYQDPTTPQAIKETLFGGAMGSIGGGVIGGGMAGLSRAATQKAPVSEPQSVQPTSTDPAILPSGPPPGPLEKAAAIGEKTGANEMKRQEQALSLTGVENEVSQTGIQNQGNSEVSAGSPSGTEGTEQTDIAIGAGSTEPSGASLGIGDIPAQPTDVAPATLSGPATTAPQDESQAADVEPPPLNTPAAPEPLPSPVSTAATSPQILQAESAGVPTLTTEGVSSNAPQTQEAVSPAPGRKEESASAPGAGGVTSAASADADRKKDVDALAIQAARLRESASLAIGQKRVALNALASRMEAAREAIVGRAEATHKDSLSVQPAPAKKGLDLSTRTDLQLTILERHRNQKVRELAAAERARRTANEQPMVDEQPTYQGMTVEEMARVASRHGHDYESAVEKIREKPRLWIEAVQKWIEIDDLEKKAEDKQKRAAKWTPNERQKKVISIVSESSTFSKSSDIPMFPQNSKSTRALMSRGILSRIDLGDLVEYRLNNLQADAEIARREGVPQGVAPVVANKTPSDAPQAALSVAGNQQNVPGDIPTDISAPKSLPAETNQSTTEAVSKKPKAVQNNLPPIARRDDLVGAIMRVTGGDGIHSSMAPDTVGDSANRATKLRGLFTKRGTIDLGDVAMRLREDEDFDVRDGEHLSEMIRQASFGEVPVSMARQERDADAAKEKEHRDRIREKAKKYGVKAVGVKFSDLESRVFAMMDARNKKAVAALDGRAQKRFEAAMSESQNALSDDELDAVLADLSQQGMSPRDFWNKATATVLKMAEEARQERALDAEPTTEEPSWFADFPDESGNRSTGSGRESQPVDQAPSQPGLELAGQTADELAKQEAERVAAEKAQKADKAQAEADEKAATGRKAIKQASDAAASTFELGGDAMANLTGQVDMFATVATSKPAAAPIKPEGGPEDAAQDRPDGAHVFLKAPDGTVDFGEITPAMAESMKRQAGKIRLERGDDSYGEQHIELRHGKDIRGVGFKSVAEFVSEALQNISAIWKPSKTSQLVVVEAIEHGKVVFVELKPSDSGDYYTVNSAFPTPANYAEKKGKSAGWVKLWSGMALPPSAPAARTPSADRPSEKAGEGDATPSSKSSDSSVVNQTSESKPANTEDAATTRFQKGETRHNLSDDTRAFPVDRALYDMAQEGRTSAEILSFIGKASRRPFNRLLATHLARIGVSSTITLDSQGGWQFGNTSRAQRYAAAYNPRTDTVALFTPREAERHILHELVHAATLKAIASGGVSAMRMRRLFLHVQRSGRLSGQYGMSSLDEFVAEAFSNPRFQEALRSVPAPAGSILKSAWQWFVNIVARVLGFRTNVAKTALDRALTTGAQLMRENAGIAAEETRYSLDGSQPFDGREVALTPRLAPNGRPSNLNEHQWQQVRTPEFKAWFGDWESAAKLEWLDTGKPIAMMSGDEVPVFPKLKLLAQWVGKYWADEHGGGVVNPDLGRIVLDETAASFSIGHGLSRSKANAFYLVPKVLENGVVLGQLPKVANKPDAYVIAAPVAIGEKTYRELVEVRIDQNMHRMYVHEVVLREESPDSAFNSSAASSSGKAEPQGARHGAIWNFMLSLRKVKASRAVDANGEPLASQVDQWESDQSSGDIRFSAASDWYNGPSGAPVRNAWQRAKAKAAEILSPKNLDKIIYELQDKYVDLKRLREHIQSIGGTITDMNDAYLGEELYHKRLAHRTEEFLKAELRPLLAEMKARSVGVQDLETFLHARHAPEANAEMAKRNPNQAEIDAGQQKSTTRVRNLEQRLQSANAKGAATVALEQALNDARGELLQWNGAQAFRGTEEERRSLSGLSDAAAAAIMNGLTPERRANLDALAARVDALNERTLQLLQSYGLMSRESLDTWRKTYQYYIPLHRDEAHPDSVNHPIGQGFSVKGDAAKRRTGSNQSVTNILGHIAMQREAALTRGEKNHVMRKLYLMARQNPLADVWKVGDVPTIDTIDKATGFVKTVPDPLYKTRPNVLLLRIAGKDVAIAMNEHNPQALRMAQALKNLDVDDLHYLIPVVGKMTRYFASINTQYNPIFGVINLMRDTQEAALNLSTTELAGKQKEVMTDTLSILKEVLKNKGRMPKTGAWATLFEEFNRVGGTTGYRDLFLDAESRSKSLLSELQALDRGKVSQAAHAVADWLSDYNEAMENATRLAAYKAAIDNGMSKERAASLAKNLTVNFNRKGRQTRELGALYAFFNAAVQGTTRMAQTLSGPAGRKILAGGVLLGVVNALLGIAMMGGAGDEDDEWEKIPEFVKERSIVIPTGKDAYLSIPMPLGFQFLPNIGRLAVEMAVYKDKTAGKQMVALFQVLADAFNPMGGSSPALQIAAPTVLDPFVALAQNKDWTGKPIFIENRNSLDPKPGLQRSKDSATPWAKGLADAINAITGGTEYTPGGWSPTPDQIDYVIGQLTGGIGREAGKVASTAAAPFTGEELPPYKIPLIGRLYGSTAGHSGQSEKFYENVTKANEAQNEIKGRVRAGISVADYLADHPGAISLAARGNVAERQVAALRKARHDVVTKGGPDEVSKVREINERIANVMRNFNRDADLIGKRSGQ